MRFPTKFAIIAYLASFAAAHSWVEQLSVISPNGSFVGAPGYVRNNVQRGPGFSDPLMVHILPTDGQPTIEERDMIPTIDARDIIADIISTADTKGIKVTDSMCKKVQQQQTQSNGNPRLKAAPGDMVALRYQENGHVTLPQNQPGKSDSRGTVYVYGTSQPKENENFLDVFNKWTADGSGGDKRGVLLAKQPFDDGRCYQVNSGQISSQRQQQFPHPASQLMGADLWCQNDIKIPSSAPDGKPYSLYWVWDWPTAPNVDPGLPDGKAEVYTSCMDIDISGTPARKRDNEPRAQAQGADINNAAIPSYMSQLAAASVPAHVAATSAPPAATSTPATPAAATPPAAQAPAPAPAASSADAGAPAVQSAVAAAVSELKQNIASEVASLVAAGVKSATAQNAVTVTVTTTAQQAPAATPVQVAAATVAAAQAAAASASSAQAAAAASSMAAAQAAAASVKAAAVNSAVPTTLTTRYTSTATPASSSAAGMPPASLDIQTPQGLFSGTATPANPISTAVAAATSAVAAHAGAPYAAGNSTTSGQVQARTCNNCDQAKRSRILGSAAQ